MAWQRRRAQESCPECPDPTKVPIRAAVEAEVIRAGRDDENERQENSGFGGIDTHVMKYIMRVFLAFSKAICKLGLAGPFNVRDIESKSVEFLQLLARYTCIGKVWKRRWLGMGMRFESKEFQQTVKNLENTPEWEEHKLGLRGVEDELLAILDGGGDPNARWDWTKGYSEIYGFLNGSNSDYRSDDSEQFVESPFESRQPRI